MRTLAFDTTGTILTVGVAADGQTLYRRDHPATRDKGNLLNLAIDEVLSEVKWSRKEVEAVALLTGPGSLTATRIGWATAVGWAQARDIPVTGWTVPFAHRRVNGDNARDAACCIHYRGDIFLLYDLDSVADPPEVVHLVENEHRHRAPRLLTGPGILGNRDRWVSYYGGSTNIANDADAFIGADTLALWAEVDIRQGHILKLHNSPLDYGLPPDFKKLESA